MRTKSILSALFLSFAFPLAAQYYHDTQGKLEISSSGQASYTLPIAMPPSLKDVGPVINLSYSSGQLGGIAGQGWGIDAISNISRIATRRDIDGYVDGVDFDSDDKLALDGQRLLLKTGAYWQDGSTYQTELQSNSRIEMYGSGSSAYFVVTAADGSRSWYGNYGGMNGTDLTSFYIVRFEDTDGNYITYHYTAPLGGSLCISEIKFSANTAGLAPLNSISFNYKPARRTESTFANGVKHEKKVLLDNVEVRTGGQLFRKYQLTHIADPQLGYEKVSQLQEFNGALEPANPVVFEYHQTATQIQNSEQQIAYYNNLNFSSIQLSGDFDGDGRLDFATDTQLFKKLFAGQTGDAPINLNLGSRKKIAVTTLTNGKLNQFSSIATVSKTPNSTTFDIYNLNGNTLDANYSKTISINNYFTTTTEHVDIWTSSQTWSGSDTAHCEAIMAMNGIKNNLHYEGDFNGDGISEILIINTVNENCHLVTTTYQNSYHDYTECKVGGGGYSSIESFIVDLNPAASTVLGTPGYVSLNTNVFNLSDQVYIADYDGDGKSDILAIKADKSYKIITFRRLMQAPWIEVEIIGQGVIDSYSTGKQMLFGDYNGDGKTDIMLPDTEGGPYDTLWHIYYSNPNPAGGSFFVKESHNIVEYWPNSGSYYNTQTHFNSYYAMDTNGDGKSDLVRIWRKYYKPNWTINNHDTSWTVSAFVNNIGNTAVAGNKFTLDYYSPWDHDNDSPDIPVPVVSSYRYNGLDRDLIMVRNHHNELTYINFTKDVGQDVLLKKATASGGNIVDEIAYSPMESPTAINNGLGGLGEFYSSSNALLYPFAELKKMPQSYLVSRLKNTAEGIVKFQDFKYHGLAVNLHGLGMLGFSKTARSSWYQTMGQKKIWSVTETDPLLRGALKRSYTQFTGTGVPFIFMLSGIPEGIISSTENEFSQQTEQNGLSKILRTKETARDYLTGVTAETAYAYDPDYCLPLSTAKKNFLNGSLQGTMTATNTYDSNPSGPGASYFVGRPKTSTTKTEAYGDAYESSEEYFYANSRLTKTKKRGNTAEPKYLVEEFEYGLYGNISKKTSSSEGYPAPFIAPRTAEYTYDATGRFVKTAKDAEGLVSTNNSYHPLYGTVTLATDPYGKATATQYDNWGKAASITDPFGMATATSYARSGNEYTVSTSGNDGSAGIVKSDALGRPKMKGSKNIDGTWSYTIAEYDYLGRKYRTSEPFSSGSPTQWNTSVFDDYGRVIQSANASGLITDIVYNGLAVTANDGIKTTSSVKNANGHVISSTDPGGTIYYAYYANGNLKESDYEGNKVRMEYDEWGRKKLLSDPSAGTYRYKYYPSGETYQEQTPKGTTTYILDPAGKLTEKQIEGDLTSTIIAYTYDPATKLLRFMDAFDNFHGFGQTVEYIYDSKQRLKQTWENNMDFYYQKDIEYDSFGRAEKELTFAYHNETGKSTSKKIRNTYKNGTHWQILDDASGQVLWQANTVNARGQLLAASLGNGIAIENAYDAYGLPSLIKHDRTGPGASNVMALATSFNAQRGNLMSRSSSLFGWNENFRYDSLDRLTHFTSQHGNQEIQKYDAKGRIAENNAGRYAYSSSESPYRNTSVALNPAGAAYYANREGLFNDSMEEDRDWNKNSVDLSRISYDNSKSKTGAYSLKISTTPINVNYVHSSKLIPIDNAVPTSYTFSGWAYSVNSTAQIVLFMYNADETGYYTQVEHVSTGVTNAWTYIEATVAVPASIKKLGIRADNLGTGTVWFDDIRIKKTANAPTEQRELNISYNALQDPVHIEETGVDKISFFYNGLDSRNAIYYGGLQDDIYKRASRKYYSNAGDVEIKFSRSSGKVEFTQFIGGDGYTAPLLLRSDGTAQQYLYLHRDYQGTILAITDQAANIVEKRLFDAWGNIAKVQDGQGNDLAGLTILDRGYTGHEHLQSVGLVHMNGRLYDARLRRFLQADNFVQEPHNTQNYNRYGYVLNNPLKYTDPSGEEFTMLAAVLIGAAIGAASYTITALTADVPFTAGGFLKSAVMGAISGAVTNGIGSYAESIKQLGSRIVFQALAHAFFQGTVSGVQGGNFWTGFASGAISSLVSSAWGGGKMEKSNTAWKGLGGNWGHSDFGTIAFGTVSGGAGAALTGGNFWQGAATGLTVSLLNHVVHKIDQRSTLLSRFKNKALAFQKADVSDEGIATLHQNVEGLVEGYKAGNSPTHSYDLVGNDYVAITENGNVSLNKGLISSKNNLYFAGLLFHEYRHAFQYSAPYTIGGKRYANRFDAWTEFYGSGYKGEGGVWNMMELDAYSAQYRFGDNQPYVSERINKYYSNMLNIWKK